jgi:hypothetical protein
MIYITRWFLPMFTYGAYRQFPIKQEYPNELFTTRIFFSITNGVIYTLPPYGIFKLVNLINRTDIYNISHINNYNLLDIIVVNKLRVELNPTR